MKFYCDQCQTKYAIGDDKVRGKILKVRCKKCGYVITVREPTTPATLGGEASSSAAQAVSTAASIQWYYALNGQTMGPYEEHVLNGMYERGEIGDGTYVWNETFVDGWKLATDTEPFATAIRRSQQVRPKHKTIGVSAALQAIKVEEAAALSAAEQQGVAPASAQSPEAPREDDFARRLGELRSKLQEKPKAAAQPAKSAEVAKPAQPVHAAKPAAEPRVATSPTRQPETEEPMDTREVGRDELAAMLGSELGVDASSLPPVQPAKHTLDDALPSFDAPMQGGTSDLPSFGEIHTGESVIDFSKLRSNDDPNPFAQTKLGAGTSEQFEVSNSLLIQMSQIKKQGRGQRFLIGVAAVALIGGLAGVAVTLSIKNSQAKANQPEEIAVAPQKKQLVIQSYSQEERSIFVELAGEDVITQDDVAAAGAGEKPTTEPKSALGDKQPIKVALNNPTKPKNNDSLVRGTGPLIKGVDSGSSLDSALNAAKKTEGTSSVGLATSGNESSSKVVQADVASTKPTNGPDWAKLKTERVGSTGPQVRPADTLGPGPSSGFGGSGLSQEDAKAGFEKVKNSVASCRQRQVSRGLPTEAVKINVTLEISPDGSVTEYRLDPASMQHTEFDLCMQSHIGRWSFKPFEGKAVKIRRTYVLQ
jgi:predicted Zn finger-like uncharacterized protein